MIRTARSIAVRALVRRLGALAVRHPRFALRAADVLAPFVWRRLPAAALSRVFPELSSDVAKQVRRRAMQISMRNYVLIDCMRIAGMNPVRALVAQNERLASLRPPLILGTFHVGAISSLGAALERLSAEVLVLRASPPIAADIAPSLAIQTTYGDEQRRALAFHTALDRLRGGGFVFMPLDPEESARIAAPFRGGTLQLARGPFAMSRIMRVPIVPIVARWSGIGIEIEVGDALESGEEPVVAAAAAAWLERYLLEHPLEISRRVLDLTT